jgi:5-methylcytosine-specific restriction protein A
MLQFVVGDEYSRDDVKERAGLVRGARGGPWDTGIVKHGDEFIVFANIGIEGRTGHDYPNRWEGDLLFWSHQTRSKLSWPSVKELLEPERVVHVFCRDSNPEKFKYSGRAQAISAHDGPPVNVLWSFPGVVSDAGSFEGPDDVPSGSYMEGAVQRVTVNRYERDCAARQACIEHYGARCGVCDLDFEDRYGSVGRGYIHVHHMSPISEIGASYEVDPIRDLRPICPNCHAVVHMGSPMYSLSQVRAMLKD